MRSQNKYNDNNLGTDHGQESVDRSGDVRARHAAAASHATLLLEDNRAHDTKRAYKGSVKEYRSWCTEQNFEDGDLVTEEKLQTYLISYL